MTIPEQTSHAMFQLTGALRNVASEEITWQHFVETGATVQLCTSMELFSADLDLISNVARTIRFYMSFHTFTDRQFHILVLKLIIVIRTTRSQIFVIN